MENEETSENFLKRRLDLQIWKIVLMLIIAWVSGYVWKALAYTKIC